uniref:Endo-1,4-beta-xylanase n=1 Tax=Orpinomyces sp. LT-3 TaxID=1085606 RepID=G3FNU2_9FUNG|nr:endo-1,4-beta-xylanase [Orpinomyces sp. LT-3]
MRTIKFLFALAITTVAKAQWGGNGGASAGQKLSVGGGQNQHKGVFDGFSYEIWLDNTGGSGSMTLGKGATFKAEWSAAVNRGNFLARRGLDFGSTKKATDYEYIGMDYEASYRQTASASGNSRLCVYGWFQNRGAQGVPLVEYYIIEDWVDWVPDAQGKMVTIDGAQYKIFQMDHTGPTINGGNETFKQYFSVRQQKRTSGHITVSDHFKAWASQGWGIGNLYEVALNAEGWQSSGVADVTKLDVYTTKQGSAPRTTTTTTRTTTRTTTKTLPTSGNKCSAKITAQGYKCCSDPNCVIYYTDEDGTWGVENNQWCGCGVEACSSKITAQGYKCCSDPKCVVYYTDDDGKWGVEDNEWCGCGF